MAEEHNPSWTRWPSSWSEDDATVLDPDHETASTAWSRLYGEALNIGEAVAIFDGGDAVFTLMPRGRVLVSSWPGNCSILQVPPPPLPPLPSEIPPLCLDSLPIPPPYVPAPPPFSEALEDGDESTVRFSIGHAHSEMTDVEREEFVRNGSILFARTDAGLSVKIDDFQRTKGKVERIEVTAGGQRVVDVNDWQFYCQNCDQEVIPHLGLKKDHTFHHKPEFGECYARSGEGARHYNSVRIMAAKLREFCEAKRILTVHRSCGHPKLVLYLGDCEVLVEKQLGDFKPDVVVRRGDVIILTVEIVDTHKSDGEKWLALAKISAVTIEVGVKEVIFWSGDQPIVCQRGLPECYYCAAASVESAERNRKKEPGFEWTEEQLAALAKIDEWFEGYESFFSLTGPAGTGKSTLMCEVIRRYPNLALMAMTGKAALRLSQITGRTAATLHSKMYFPPEPGEDLRFISLRPPEASHGCVDESSMMSPSVFDDLSRWGVRVLLVGDSYQLPPVITNVKEKEQYGEDYSVFSQVGGASLSTVMRSVGGVLRAATRIRTSGELYLQSDLDADGGYEFVRCASPMEKAVDDYLNDRKDHLLITWMNATRMASNRLIRERTGHEGELPDEDEPVLLRRNGQGYLNGEIVTCTGFEAGPVIGSLQTLWMTVSESPIRILVTVNGGSSSKGGEFFDGQQPWIEDWKKYHVDLKSGLYPEPIPATWAYCVTAHAAQGSEARRVTVFLNNGQERFSHFRKLTTLPSGERVSFAARWGYTAISRGKKRATLVLGK